MFAKGFLISFLFSIFFLGFLNLVHAQKKRHKLSDSLLINKNTDTAVSGLINKIESYTFTIDHTNFLIKNQIDVTPIAIDLLSIDKRLEGFKARLESKGNLMNLRSINSATILVKEVAEKLSEYQNNLSGYRKELLQSNKEVQKIIQDPILNQSITDSVLKEQMEDILHEGKSLDSVQLHTISRVNLILNHVSISLLQADDIVSDMGYLFISKKSAMWGMEEKPLFNATPVMYHQSFIDISWQTLQRSTKIISIYLTGKWNVMAICLMILIFITAWCLSNLYRIKKSETASKSLDPVHVLNSNAILGCLMAFFTYMPFFFANPPMSFLHLVELFRLCCLSFLIFPFFNAATKRFWALLSILWIYYAVDDLLLESAFAERWLLFSAGLIFIIIILKLLFNSKVIFKKLTPSSATKAVLIFSLAQVILSVILNIAGRVTLAKIMGISAIQCLMLGFSLQIFCVMVLEAIYLQSEAVSKSRFSDFINFKELQIKLKTVLWILASIIWIVSLLRNYTMDDVMLLIRLSIWTLGFLIAVAAAGIPLDRLSFMLGALGIGIGFGLQNIVNNLVSGIIIAFERPIQVGDIIEVGNMKGTVEEIGVRSSKMKNSEGADIIVPNGDLLSQHLINWTMQDNKKRFEFLMVVPYLKDFNKMKSIIQSRLVDNKMILQTPNPSVIIQSFTDKGIELKIMCWVPDLTKAGLVRSEVMADIYNSLLDVDIVNPY